MAAFTSRDAVVVIVALLLAALGFAYLDRESLAFGCVTAAAALASPGTAAFRTGTTIAPPLGGTVQGPLQGVQTPRHKRRTPVAGVPVGDEGKSPPAKP